MEKDSIIPYPSGGSNQLERIFNFFYIHMQHLKVVRLPSENLDVICEGCVGGTTTIFNFTPTEMVKVNQKSQLE